MTITRSPQFMNSTKKTILFNSEASYLGTGYGVYYNKLISHFHNTGKYNVVELASFASPDDPRNAAIPWTFVPVRPNPRNQKEVNDFKKNEFQNTYGKWKFEETLCKYKPSHIIECRDPWMCKFQVMSPLRKFYKLIAMPTVDAEVMHPEWLAMYANTDKVFTYTDFGFKQLLKQGRGSINLVDSAPAGADYEVFRPLNINREMFGIDKDAIIIGMVAKNQKRKLFPDLIQGFSKLLAELPKEKADKVYLYLHTCWPDIGWNLPELSAESGVGNHILCTYVCKACNRWFPSIFSYSNRHCVHCQKVSARMPETHDSLSRQDLAVVYNLMDVYVQFSKSEGQGIPAVEAAACGLPIMEVDYSAMEDLVRKLGGFPIAVKAKDKELETGRLMAIPDIDDFVRIAKYLVMLPDSARRSLGFKCRENALKHYNWETTCRKWETVVDNLEGGTPWNLPKQSYTPNMKVPQGLSQYDFVKWSLINVAHRYDLVDTYWHASLARDLLWNSRISNMPGFHFNEASLGYIPSGNNYSTQDFLKEMVGLCNELNYWEEKRCASV